MRKRHHRPALTVGLLVIGGALAFSGCTSASSDDTTSTEAEDATAETEATEDAADASADAGGMACLTGTWLADQSSLQSFYDDASAAMESGSFSVEGTATLTLGGDEFTWAPDATVTMHAEGMDIQVVLGGTSSGGYTADETTITTDTDVVDGLVFEVTVDGAPFDASMVNSQIAAAPVDNATYTCTGDTLVVVSDIEGSPATTTMVRQ